MNKTSPKPTFSLSGILCSALGHQYTITRKITNHINEYKCSQCGREVTNNPSGYFEALNFKNKQINASLEVLFRKRSRKIATK